MTSAGTRLEQAVKEEEQITIVFCNPNGATTEMTLERPSWKLKADYGETAWDKKEATESFREFLENLDGHGLEAPLKALDRLGCWHEAIGQLTNTAVPNEKLGNALLLFWQGQHGFHIAESLKGNWNILIDALRHLLEPYSGPSLRLYRGELFSRHERGIYGIAWTPQFDTARTFANRREHLGEGHGVILEIAATPEMIVCSPSEHSVRLNEIEYVLDPRLIREVRAVA